MELLTKLLKDSKAPWWVWVLTAVAALVLARLTKSENSLKIKQQKLEVEKAKTKLKLARERKTTLGRKLVLDVKEIERKLSDLDRDKTALDKRSRALASAIASASSFDALDNIRRDRPI